MTLPKDLQIHCRKRILKRVIPCIILISVFATILLLWGNIIFNTENKVLQISCYVIVMIFPFAITGVPHKLIDQTYYGTVKKVEIETTTDSEYVRHMREYLYLKNTIYLTVEKSDGKLIHKKAFAGKARLQQNLNTYHEGDMVFHLYGTDTVVVFPDSADHTIHCVVCGSSNQIEDDQCRDCGHSLIKNI